MLGPPPRQTPHYHRIRCPPNQERDKRGRVSGLSSRVRLRVLEVEPALPALAVLLRLRLALARPQAAEASNALVVAHTQRLAGGLATHAPDRRVELRPAA